jgi:hypothetical protein
MITQKFTVTLISFINFDGVSDLWKDFPYHSICRDKESGSYCPAHLKGSVWHYGLRGFYGEREPSYPGFLNEEVTVTSDFIFTHEASIEYKGKTYRGTINFGLDQSVLALHIWEVGVKGRFFKNAVKLYTTIPTTKEFLHSQTPLFE